MTNFSGLKLDELILRAVSAAGYTTPTPIQAMAIPPILDGNDVLGCAQTGTGKTAAFLLPMLQKMTEQPRQERPVIRGLILSPTRELASQIGENCDNYSQFLKLRHLVIFGGVKQTNQVRQLQRGIDVLIATPGRLLDLHRQGFISFADVSFFVLDEADRMLDMGFLPDINRLLSLLPKKRQNLLFSATMPSNIVALAKKFLTDPIRVEVDPQSTTVEQIDQTVLYVEQPNKKRLLVHLLQTLDCHSTIVFTRTKHGANRVVQSLEKAGIQAAAIHGNKSQNARTKALARFKSGDISVLVATDIASRGIDVDGISHVFNYDLPNVAESYVHRIGRTGRAGSAGTAIAFCNETEAPLLWAIEQLIGKEIPDIRDHKWHCYPALEQLLVLRVKGEERAERAKRTSQKKKKPPFRRRRRKKPVR